MIVKRHLEEGEEVSYKSTTGPGEGPTAYSKEKPFFASL